MCDTRPAIDPAALLAAGYRQAPPAMTRDGEIAGPYISPAAWADSAAWDDTDNRRKGTRESEDNRVDAIGAMTRSALRGPLPRLWAADVTLHRVPRAAAPACAVRRGSSRTSVPTPPSAHGSRPSASRSSP
ncbi:hypothetical protein [Planomonospora algeriensis]